MMERTIDSIKRKHDIHERKQVSERRLAMYERYVDKLRLEDHDKLTRFCKMHLSFLLDMDNERFEELFEEKLDQKTKLGHRFLRRKSTSSKNETSMLTERITVPADLESAISRVITYLQSSQHLCQEGIFRKSGNILRQKQLKDILLSGTPVDLSAGVYSTHDCASTLKSLLADLQEPLLLERLFDAHLSTSDIKSDDRRSKVICLLIQMLPSEHHRLSTTLFGLLHKVAFFSEKNKMSADNLGAMFAPHLLPSKKMSSSDLHLYAIPMQEAVSFMITNSPDMFKVPEMLALDAIYHIKKANISISTSEDSILSVESVDSAGHSRRNKVEQEDEPMNTILTFADRGVQNSQDTEVELAKLYAHVQSMPDSTKKRKLMKQFSSESSGYHKQVQVRRKHSRSRSFGESIKRRFSKRGKSVNLNKSTSSTDQNQPECSSNNPISYPAASSSSDKLPISALAQSPYLLHKQRSSLHNLQNTSIAQQTNNNKTLDTESCETPELLRPVPAIRKALMPSSAVNSTPESRHISLKRTQDYKNTPPGPKRGLVIMDSTGIRV